MCVERVELVGCSGVNFQVQSALLPIFVVVHHFDDFVT